MTKDETLKLALDALETLHDENMDYLTRNKLGGENNQCMVFAREAITAIKEALAQPEQGWTPERIAGMARLKETQDKKLAQRTWVGLTDEDKEEIKKQANYHWEMTTGEYAQIVQNLTEVKLKQKNEQQTQ